MIRHAKIKELPKIMGLASACTSHMTDLGIYQWNEQYPSIDSFKRDIARKELYVLEDDDKIIGVIAISTLIDGEYESVRWLTKNNSTLYVHRLAVHPKYQGLGFAQQLMSFAENKAKKEKYSSIRLDTFSKNVRNQKFYEIRGYHKLENVYFPMQSEFPFHCYELLL